MSVGVEHVVGEFEFLERDALSGQLFTAQRRVRMCVEARRYRRVSLPFTHMRAHTFIQTFTSMLECLQCFDAVGWAAGRASGL